MPDFLNNQVGPAAENKFLEWIVLRKIQLKTAFKILLIASSLALWGYGIYGLADWFFISGPAERAAIARLHENLVNYSVRKPVKPIEVRASALIANLKYDAYARVRNPNPNWSAVFEYGFSISGEELRWNKGFILPGEEKFLFDLGIPVKDKPGRTELVINGVKWRRVRSEVIPDYETFKASRLAFGFSAVEYVASLQVAGRAVSRAEFTVTNRSGFGYFEVPLQIILWRGGSVAGINRAVVSNLSAGESRFVSVTWFEPIAGITKVEVRPDLNIMDDSIYND